MSQITQEDVERLAGLARIRLNEDEKLKLTQDMGSILEFVEQLMAVDTTGIEPIAQITGLENMFRVDDPEQAVIAQPDIAEKRVDLLLGQVPSRDGQFLKIKAILKK